MELSPAALRSVEFRGQGKKYVAEDVDVFVESVAVGVEEMQAELRSAQARADKAEGRVMELMEDNEVLRRTLVTAQRTADAIVAEAHEQAAKVTDDAQVHASRLVAEADAEVAGKRASMAGDIEAEVESLRSQRDGLAADVAELERRGGAELRRLRGVMADALATLDYGVSKTPAGDGDDESGFTFPPAWREADAEGGSVAPEGQAEGETVSGNQGGTVIAPAEHGQVEASPEAAQPEVEHDAVSVETHGVDVPEGEVTGDEDHADVERRQPPVDPPDAVWRDTPPEGKWAADESDRTSGPSSPSEAHGADHAAGDPYLDELKQAASSTEPLGPRDDPEEVGTAAGAGPVEYGRRPLRRFGRRS